MPFTVSVDCARHGLVVEFSGSVDGAQLLEARLEAARANDEGHQRQFILDFSAVRVFELDLTDAERLREMDTQRAATLSGGRCAIVGTRALVVEGLTFLTAVSVLPLDFRLFRSRADAEAWLEGKLAYDPPRPPRRR